MGIGAPRGVGVLGALGAHQGHWAVSCVGVHWGLAGSKGAQGPAGV